MPFEVDAPVLFIFLGIRWKIIVSVVDFLKRKVPLTEATAS